MTGKLKAKGPTTRDRIDDARLKATGTPAHINAIEDRLLGKLMPESHGKVTRGGLLAEAGQGADDRVTLLTPKEQKLLALLGGSGTANPATGLLSFEDGDGTGTSGGGNTGSGGPSGGGMGGGSTSGGPSGGGGGPSGPVGGDTSFGGYTNDPSMRSDYQESEISNATNQPDWSQYNMLNTYIEAQPNTWGRLWQIARYGMPAAYRAQMPGRYGAPNKYGSGIVGTAVGTMVGGPMSAAMRAGAMMGAAQTPEQQEASMRESQALGSRNSTGNENARLGHTVDALGSPVAGSGGSGGLLADGAAVSAASTVAPGGVTTPTVQPGQVMDTSGRGNSSITGLPQPVQNLLADYIWRGRQGRGLNW